MFRSLCCEVAEPGADGRRKRTNRVDRSVGVEAIPELVERLGSDAHRTRQIYGLTDYGSEIWQAIDAEHLA